MRDEIFAQTPTYQRLVKKGREEGLEEGLQKCLEALRQTVVDVVQERFPEIAILAQKQVAGVEDTTLLRHLIVKMSTVQTVQEAIQLLISIDGDAKKN